jgi:hypothetical protein
MKKNTRKLSLSRESLRRLSQEELRRPDGGAAAATIACPYTLEVLACYSRDVHTCYSCTV